VEYWNDGIMGSGKIRILVYWEFFFDTQMAIFKNESLPFKTTFFAPAPRCSVPPLRGGFPVSNIPN